MARGKKSALAPNEQESAEESRLIHEEAQEESPPGYSEAVAHPVDAPPEEDLISEEEIRRLQEKHKKKVYGWQQFRVGKSYHISIPGWEYRPADFKEEEEVVRNHKMLRAKITLSRIDPEERYLRPEFLAKRVYMDHISKRPDCDPNSSFVDVSGFQMKDGNLDFTKYGNLSWLSVRDNLLENPNTLNLTFCRGLRTLDISNNNIKDIALVVELIESLPWLVSIGVEGNPFVTKKYKKDYRWHLLLRLPGLRTNSLRLRYIDDLEISMREIIEPWKYSNGDPDDMDRYKFYMGAHRQLIPGTRVEDMQELKLPDWQLRHVDFEIFQNITRLCLSANRITSMTLARSNIQFCPKIEFLDLRGNLIDDIKLLAVITDDAPLLDDFSYSGNPCFPKDNSFYRFRFLQLSEKNASLDHPNLVLNGRPLSFSERVAAIPNSVMGPLEKENWKFLLGFHKIRLVMGKNVTLADMSNQHLVLLGDMRTMASCECMDLSNNSLWTFRGTNFWSLRNLRYLDLRGNNFKNMEVVITELQGCHKLRKLYMLECTRTGRTDHPEKYLEYVCGYLRGLDFLDDNPNPTPWSEEQEEVIDALTDMCNSEGNERVGPNTICNLDLSGLGLQISQFTDICMYLSYLPVEHLRIENNPLCSVPFYRLALVESVPTLKSVNGSVVTIEERSAALKLLRSCTIEKLVEDAPMYQKATDSMKGIEHVVEARKSMSLADQDGTKEVMNVLTSTDKPKSLVEDPTVAPDAVEAFETLIETAEECVVGGFGESSRGLGAFPADWMPKVEVFLGLMQNLAMVLMLDMQWPSMLLRVFSWLTLFSLDLEIVYNVFGVSTRYEGEMYWKYGIMIFFPLIFVAYYVYKATGMNLLRIAENEDKVSKLEEGHSKVRCYTSLLFSTICFFVLCATWFFVVYVLGRLSHEDHAITKAMALATLIGGICGIVFFTTCCMGFIFYAKNPEDGFWFFLEIFEKRIVYFMLFLLYVPCIRMLCLPFTMSGSRDDDDCSLTYFPDTACTGVLYWPVIQWVSVILLPVYLLATPLWFIFMIHYGSTKLNEATGLDEHFETIKHFWRAYGSKRKDVQVLCKDRVKKLEYRWQRLAKHFPLAQSYLFSSYRFHYRYFKIWLLIEKLVLLLFIETAIPDNGFWNHLIVVMLVSAGYLISFLFRPYASDVEDWIDMLLRFAFVFTVYIGLFNEQLVSHPDASEIMGILSIFIVFLNIAIVLMTAVLLVRSCCHRNRAVPFHHIRNLTTGDKIFSLPKVDKYISP